MNIKDMYLHGGSNIVKNITFSIPSSGTNSGKLVATITWAKEGAETTTTAIPINTSIFGSVTKNTVLAGPNGSNGNPSFRALVAADIPDLAASKIASGVFDAARLPLASNSAKGTIILGVAQTSDQDSAITGKKYWVKMNANGKLFVDIPWADNTHYTAIPILGGSTATSNATSDTTNDATYLNIIENSAKSGGIQITGSGATTVKANGGKLTINSTNTWKAANSTQEGYVPQLVNNGSALSNSSNDYVLAFTYASGTLTPSWRKLPANAYLNTWTQFEGATSNSNGTAGYLPAPGTANIDKFLKGDGTWANPYFAIENLTDWATTTTTTASSIVFDKVWWKIAPTSSNKVYGIGIHPTNGLLYYIYNNKGTYTAAAYTTYTDTWRAVYVKGTQVASTKTSSYAINFIEGSNITITEQARGTGEGQSGSTSYFNVKIEATDTLYTLKVGTSASASDVVTLLSGTGTTSGTILTQSAYSASNKLATMADVNSAITSMFKFQNNTSALPTGTQKVGYAYRVSSAFTLADANSASGDDEVLEVGDLLICIDATTPKYLVLNTNWTVDNKAATLGTSATTIATIGGVNITASLPTASRSGSTVTAGIITPTTSGTEKFLREDGTWVKPSYISNTDRTGIKLATVSGTKKTDSTVIIANSSTGLSIAGGTNKFSIGDGTNYIEVSVAHGLSTKNMSINGTNYALYTSASSLPTIKAPTEFGTANQILATNSSANGLTWVDKPTTNVTTSLYVGASDGTATAAQTAGNVHLILKEGSSYTRYKITGSGRASVTSDANGTITINSAGYSNFVKSGTGAAAGLVPSPGTTAGTGKFLCEDGTWKIPSYIANTDEKVKQSETTSTDYRGVVLGYNKNAAANTGVSGTVTEQVYISNNLTVQPSTGSISSKGTGTFAGVSSSSGFTSTSGDLIFNSSNHILWNKGTTWQRIFITDDSTADTAVFTFQQSSDSGTNWTNLMTIKDNGNITITKVNGYTLADACAKAVTDSSSASAIGTGTSLTTERDIYYGLPTINGVHNYTSSSTFFAPTSAGTSGQILKSNGSGAPSWITVENYTTSTIVSANYSLSKDSWTAVSTALPTTSGTYALYIDDSTNGSYAGIFAIEGGAKEKLDEIPLHWATAATTTADSKRVYAAIKEGKLQLASNDSSATTYTLTIKYKRII